MKKFLGLCFFYVIFIQASSAQNISAGNDTTICQGSGMTLHVTIDSAGAITQLNLPDDTYSPVVDLGFSFNYYGNVYTQVLLSTNVYIYFNIGEAGQYSVWPIGNAIPTTASGTPQNAIMGPWHDVDPSVGTTGIMSYATFGSAPNRYFVFNFCNVPMFSCNNLLFTGQIILYEGSNIIETHITEKVVCSTWNAGAAIHGLHDSNGTLASVVPGRNFPTVWTTTNEGKRFTPDATFSTYTIDSILFAPVPMLGSLQWTDLAGNFISNDQDVPINPTQATTYVVSMTDCGVGSDTITVFVSQFDTVTTYLNPQCPNSFDGFIEATCNGTGPFLFVWKNQAGVIIQTTTSSSGNDSLLNLGPGTYTMIVTDSIGCVKQHSFTLTAATYNANFSYTPIIACKGSPLNFNNTSTGSPTSFNWVFEGGGNSSQENPTHTFNSAGNFDVTFIVFYPGGCSDTSTQTILVHELIKADFDWAPQNICEVDIVQFTDNSTLSPISWTWSFGDGSYGSGAAPTHQYTQGDYTVQMVAIDSLCGIDSITKNLTVYYQPYPDLGLDTSLCVGESLTLNAGYPGTSYIWSTGGTAQSLIITAAAPTVYVVAVNNHGCVGYDTIFVDLKCNVVIPSAFSPNDDGFNDLFRPRGNKVTSYKIKIFNRWGQVIYLDSFAGIDLGWNGKFNGEDCEVGVYIYQIDVTYVNGVHELFDGNVTLLR